MVAPKRQAGPPKHDSTIYVFSQVPLAICEEILQAVTRTERLLDEAYYPWHIKNRYYSTDVHFCIVDSLEHLRSEITDGASAVMLIIDRSKMQQSVCNELLHRIDVDAIEIPLIIGKRSDTGSPSISAEEHSDRYISAGWEYIDLSQTDVDDAGGQTGISRLSEALQAHVWPDSVLQPPRMARLTPEEEDLRPQEAEALHQERTGRIKQTMCDTDVQNPSLEEPSNTMQAHKAVSHAFDDEFAPFVSATDSRILPGSTEVPSLASSSFDVDYNNLAIDHDLADPTSGMTNMFAALSGLRDQAMAMPYGEKRKAFAEEIALRFARQLDTMMASEENLTET